jgi:hypothetical protein
MTLTGHVTRYLLDALWCGAVHERRHPLTISDRHPQLGPGLQHLADPREMSIVTEKVHAYRKGRHRSKVVGAQ